MFKMSIELTEFNRLLKKEKFDFGTVNIMNIECPNNPRKK